MMALFKTEEWPNSQNYGLIQFNDTLNHHIFWRNETAFYHKIFMPVAVKKGLTILDNHFKENLF